MLKDKDNQDIKGGFYFDISKGEIIYFTGNYENSFALSETRWNSEHHFTDFATSNWVRIQNLEKFAQEMREDLKWAVERKSRKSSTNFRNPFQIDDCGPFGKHPFKKGGDPPHPHKKY